MNKTVSAWMRYESDSFDRLLHPVPAMSQTILALAQETSDLHEIAEFLHFDPILAGWIMQTANHETPSDQPRCSTIRDAVEQLGLDTLAQHPMLNPENIRSEALTDREARCWMHKVAVSEVCSGLATRNDFAECGAVRLAGLMHDIGRTLFTLDYPCGLDILTHVTCTKPVCLDRIERFLFGETHAQMGARILKHLNFAEEIIQAICNHHTIPVLPRNRNDKVARMASTIRMADLMVSHCGMGTGEETKQAPVNLWELESVPIKLHEAAEILSDTIDSIREVAEAMAIELPDDFEPPRDLYEAIRPLFPVSVVA